MIAVFSSNKDAAQFLTERHLLFVFQFFLGDVVLASGWLSMPGQSGNETMIEERTEPIKKPHGAASS
ncbi:hypothetical protein ACIQW9_05245 [Herminiimonas sp. NPDC097707]|uniref:hypothetical protein n=1 Tax=Herminiimonas sp. NPDC097707 TaxID=3364007 RepID=UPI00383AEDE8